jgi:F-type H+-transporting ATPase subunit c
MKALSILAALIAVTAVCALPVAAQTPAAAAPAVVQPNWAIGLGAGLGAALTIIGAGYGISTIAGKAVESMARQPEVAPNVQGAMIISAALIEGVSFFSLIVCILILVLGQ